MLTRLDFLLCTVFVLTLAAGCSQGPTDYRVLSDWDMYVADHSDHFCKSTVRITEKRVVERVKRASDEVHIVLEVTGTWVGERQEQFQSGPCKSFQPNKGHGQKTRFRAIYYGGMISSRGGHTFQVLDQ